MKITFFEVKDYEVKFIEDLAGQYGFELGGVYPEPLSKENVSLAAGSDAVSTLGFSRADREIMQELGKAGVKYFSTRTVGYEHIDLASAKENGLTVLRANYNSTNVADFTVMLMLMLVRNAKVSVCRALVNNFSLDDMMGRDIRNMTIGIVGTGNIGATVIKNLSGFGCTILCNDKFPKEEVEKYATYVSIEEIYRRCDIISLHMPLTKENYHMIDEAAISMMKDGVLLVNTARGQLIDTAALIHGIESEKIGGCALDTIEGEEGICHVDIKTRISNKQNIFYIKQFPNVIFTPHIGFFTAEAVRQMVESAFMGIALDMRGEKQNKYLAK